MSLPRFPKLKRFLACVMYNAASHVHSHLVMNLNLGRTAASHEDMQLTGFLIYLMCLSGMCGFPPRLATLLDFGKTS